MKTVYKYVLMEMRKFLKQTVKMFKSWGKTETVCDKFIWLKLYHTFKRSHRFSFNHLFYYALYVESVQLHALRIFILKVFFIIHCILFVLI